MIAELQLQNFKCFKQSSVFEFSKINLLTGINGRGKSSVLQSLLLLSQSVRYNPYLMNMVINGDLIELGNFDDIKNSETPRGEKIKIHIKFKDKNIEQAIFSFNENETNPLIANTFEIAFKSVKEEWKYYDLMGIPQYGGDPSLLNENILKNTLYFIFYISADRVGPVKYVDKINLPDWVRVSPKGENTIILQAA